MFRDRVCRFLSDVDPFFGVLVAASGWRGRDSKGHGEGAKATEEHQENDADLAERIEDRSGGDACFVGGGKSDGTDRGGDFKQDERKGQFLCREQQKGEDKKDHGKDGDHARCAGEVVSGECASKDLDLFASAQDAAEHQAEDRDGIEFDSSGCSARCATDKHGEHHQQESGGCEQGKVDGVESSGAQGDRLKECGLNLVEKAQGTEAMAVFECKEKHRDADDKESLEQKDDLGIEGQGADKKSQRPTITLLFGAFADLLQTLFLKKAGQYRKAHPTEQDQAHDGKVDEDIFLVGDEALGVQGKSGVAECRDRMKDGLIGRLPRIDGGFVPRDKKQKRADAFDDHGGEDDKAQKPKEFVALLFIKDRGDRVARAQSKALAHKPQQKAGKGDDPKTTDLDHHQDHTLTKEGEISPCVFDREARHASCGSCGE